MWIWKNEISTILLENAMMHSNAFCIPLDHVRLTSVMRNIMLFLFHTNNHSSSLFSSTIIVRHARLESFLYMNMNWWILNSRILIYFVFRPSLYIRLRSIMRNIMLFWFHNHSSSLYSSMWGTWWDGYVIYEVRIWKNEISILSPF